MNVHIGSLSPDFANEILGKYGFYREDYLGMLRLEHRQQEEGEDEERESWQKLVLNLQTQMENWRKMESPLFVTRSFLLSQLQKVQGHVSQLHEIRSREMMRLVDRYRERRTVPSVGGLGRQLSFHFYRLDAPEVEKRLVEQRVSVVERLLHAKGVASHQVQEIVRTLLLPEVLQKRVPSGRFARSLQPLLRLQVSTVPALLNQQFAKSQPFMLHSQVAREQVAQTELIENSLRVLLHSQVIRERGTVQTELLKNSIRALSHVHVMREPGTRTERFENSLRTLLHSQVLRESGARTQLENVLKLLFTSQAIIEQGAGSQRFESQLQTFNQTFEQALQMFVESQLYLRQRTLLQETQLRFDQQSNHVQQVFQTLLHPQVLRTQGMLSHSINRILQTILQTQSDANLQETLLQKTFVRLDQREVEMRLLAQQIPVEHILQVLQTEQAVQALPHVSERATFRQIEKYLTERGLPQPAVQQIMQTFLHPQVQRSPADRTLLRLLRFTTDWSRLQQTQHHTQYNTFLSRQREVEKRLLDRVIPVEHIQHVLQSYNDISTYYPIINRIAQQQRLPHHPFHQVLQTLLHPQVQQAINRSVLQTTALRLDLHDAQPAETGALRLHQGDEATAITKAFRINLVDMERILNKAFRFNQVNEEHESIREATQIHRFSHAADAPADDPFTSDRLAQRRDITYGGHASIEYYRPQPAEPPPPPPALAAQPAAPVEVAPQLKLENFAPEDLQRFIDRIYREIDKRTKFERSLRGL